MKSTYDIIAALGAEAIQTACLVGEFSIRAAKRDRKFPASWFDAIEKLCLSRGMSCPRELFAFKCAEGSTEDVRADEIEASDPGQFEIEQSNDN